MHPKEFKYMKAATGRFTHLCLKNSEVHMGIYFDEHKAVQELINDPKYFPVLLFPCENAVNISKADIPESFTGGKQLLVFLLDATWNLAKRMFRLSPSLQKLPRIMFIPEQKSRFIIKKQPREYCLSTIEAVHELLRALEKARLDTYERPTQLIDLFMRMQEHQLLYIQSPTMRHHRKRPVS
jgi:DTW domain-containing protein YfiP